MRTIVNVEIQTYQKHTSTGVLYTESGISEVQEGTQQDDVYMNVVTSHNIGATIANEFQLVPKFGALWHLSRSECDCPLLHHDNIKPQPCSFLL